jgi:Sugar kinases, ribokinase family
MTIKNRILVSGLINIETTVKIPGFPLEYTPVQYNYNGIDSAVSGVGFNLAKALTSLGDTVDLVSLVGNDLNGKTIRDVLSDCGIGSGYISSSLNTTPLSVILYDQSGKRNIQCDLKDIQDAQYDPALFYKAMEPCEFLAMCNINFSRPFLKTAHDLGKTIATDVHTLSDVSDAYNADFMKYANILFLSNEGIRDSEEEFVKKLAAIYRNDIIVVGLGGKGALLYVKEDSYMGRFPAVRTREIVSTVGAGDALFSAFLHGYSRTRDPYLSLKKAVAFASYKIGTASASDGFLTGEELDALYDRMCATNLQ